jgi:hypothetical protein
VRLPNSAHTDRPWRIHEIAPDFRVEDVWALPGTGDADDFHRLVANLARTDPAKSGSRAVRTLFAIRWKLGELLNLDEEDPGAPTLRDRLPADLRDTPGPESEALPFTPLYATDDEYAAEIANRTMHGVMHLGLVPDASGTHRAQMAVLVKPNGHFGEAYMLAIKPFRHMLVYPPLIRDMGRQWAPR